MEAHEIVEILGNEDLKKSYEFEKYLTKIFAIIYMIVPPFLVIPVILSTNPRSPLHGFLGDLSFYWVFIVSGITILIILLIIGRKIMESKNLKWVIANPKLRSKSFIYLLISAIIIEIVLLWNIYLLSESLEYIVVFQLPLILFVDASILIIYFNASKKEPVLIRKRLNKSMDEIDEILTKNLGFEPIKKPSIMSPTKIYEKDEIKIIIEPSGPSKDIYDLRIRGIRRENVGLIRNIINYFQ